MRKILYLHSMRYFHASGVISICLICAVGAYLWNACSLAGSVSMTGDACSVCIPVILAVIPVTNKPGTLQEGEKIGHTQQVAIRQCCHTRFPCISHTRKSGYRPPFLEDAWYRWWHPENIALPVNIRWRCYHHCLHDLLHWIDVK